MKQIYLILTFLLFSTVMINGQSWAYSNTLMGSGNITAIGSVQDNEENVIIYGHFDHDLVTSSGQSINTYGGRDFFIAKFDNVGNVLWLKNLGSRVSDDVFGGVETDTDGNVYVTGGFKDYLLYSPSDSILSSGNYDIFLAKLGASGDILYCKNIGTGSNIQRTTSLGLDNQGNLILGGFFRDSLNILNDTTLYANTAFNNSFYSKFLSDNGDLIWAKGIYAINSGYGSRINDIQSSNDQIIFAGVFVDSILIGEDTITSLNNSQDSYIFKTDEIGNIQWVRKIQGSDNNLAYSISTDNESNIYLSGYYRGLDLTIDSTDLFIKEISLDAPTGYDFYITKYIEDGNLDWIRLAGGLYTDKLVHSAFYDGEIHVSGLFTDSLNWGGINLRTKGPSDTDMFVGALDTEGNFRSANSFGGTNNSEEDARAIFNYGENLFQIIRSNSELLVLGDSIYVSTTGMYYIALGIITCRPISIDQVIAQDVQTCFGDSTGAIQVLASGGFGAPWQYSIDNGLSYQEVAYFADLPAGDYPIVVIDAENCAQPGPTETVTQPEALLLELITEEFTGDSMVNIVVAAYGGTPPYTYTLQPNGIVQAFGDFNVKWSEPGYYIVEVNDISNCGPVATDTLTTSSGIDLFAPGVKLFPNPTSGIITIEVPFQGSEATLEVLSLTGQIMFSQQVYSNGISINETIDLSDLSKGMYMIRVDGQTLKSGVVVN